MVLLFGPVGARFDLGLLREIEVPALVLGGGMLLLKPVTCRLLLRGRGERARNLGWDLGCRLGQSSEFSLLMAYMAAGLSLIGNAASHLIQAATILTFLISSYIVVLNFPNPIAIHDRLRRD